ncbi:hypothetical protein P7H75_02945 [Vagococcus carniphilus]|uniref:hypothetical protein n=1 Tax=Vagococcus carniphilus TaxID=218144 RepID=UPI002890F750|nr:hypothetical protein [Vagococcus carniphilus]MDT2813789.1 hypothetical protein [Vagococcus carniphilus]
MDNLFLLLLLISIGFLIYSIVKRKGKKYIYSSIIGILVFFIAFGLTADTTSTSTKKEERTVTSSSEKKETTISSSKKKETTKNSEKKKTKTSSSKKEVVKSSSKEQTVSSSSEKKVAKKTNKKKETKVNKYDEANKKIANDLQMDLGWALGKLDRDGNPTENGTPDEGFSWAVFVEKIELSEEDEQLNVYVTPEFTILSDSDKKQIINSAQNLSTLYTEDYKKLFTVIYEGSKQIGRSTVLEVSDFKFD